MNDDYLWDKSGQPDPEIQGLEQILGTLRYQPRELMIPAALHANRQSFLTRSLAIAAAIALVVLGVGLWIGLHKQSTPSIAKARPEEAKEAVPVASNSPDRVVAATSIQSGPAVVNESPQPLAVARHRARTMQSRHSQLSESEVAEARAAKDQLMVALRMASLKLSQAQQKTQGINTENEIHNQHKIG